MLDSNLYYFIPQSVPDQVLWLKGLHLTSDNVCGVRPVALSVEGPTELSSSLTLSYDMTTSLTISRWLFKDSASLRTWGSTVVKGLPTYNQCSGVAANVSGLLFYDSVSYLDFNGSQQRRNVLFVS